MALTVGARTRSPPPTLMVTAFALCVHQDPAGRVPTDCRAQSQSVSVSRLGVGPRTCSPSQLWVGLHAAGLGGPTETHSCLAAPQGVGAVIPPLQAGKLSHRTLRNSFKHPSRFHACRPGRKNPGRKGSRV